MSINEDIVFDNPVGSVPFGFYRIIADVFENVSCYLESNICVVYALHAFLAYVTDRGANTVVGVEDVVIGKFDVPQNVPRAE